MEIYEYAVQIRPGKKNARFTQQQLADAEWMNTGLYRKHGEGVIEVIPYQDLGKVIRDDRSAFRVYLVKKDASYVRSVLRRYFRENGLEEYLELLKQAPLETLEARVQEAVFTKEEMAEIRQNDKQALRERRDLRED